MNKLLLWFTILVLSSSVVLGASLSFSFDQSNYDSDNELGVTISGPLDASVFVEVSSPNGFYLPLALSDLSSPSFDLVLEPGTYLFKASSTYNSQELAVQKSLILSPPVLIEEDPIVLKTKFNVSIEVTEFEGDPIDDVTALIYNDSMNVSLELNDSGEGSLILKKGTFRLVLEKKNYVSTKKTFTLDDSDKSLDLIMLPVDVSDLLRSSDGAKDDVDDSSDEESSILSSKTKVTLSSFEENVYSSVHVPILFSVSGPTSRCQVLTKRVEDTGYSIAHNILSPASFNEAILTNLQEGEYNIKVRCIISDTQAVISKLETISIINIEKDLADLEEVKTSTENLITIINSFPLTFKYVFEAELNQLNSLLEDSKELSKLMYGSNNLLGTREKISNLLLANKASTLKDVKIDSSENTIVYASLDDVDVVLNHLDLSKKNKLLLSEQENFVVKTNYDFLISTYRSGSSKKQTFVSNQVIPMNDIDHSSFDAYYIMPSFLSSRLMQSSDVEITLYDDVALVYLKGESSTIIFDGWLSDYSLIKTVILTDAQTLGSSPTGFTISDTDMPTWKIPLFSFLILIVLAGMIFNPYYSVANMFSKKPLDSFTENVHDCIDASISKEHYKVIELIPTILDTHNKLSSKDKSHSKEVLASVEELFYDSSYQLAFQKIVSKPAESWTLKELELTIKDFYGSYAKLSPQKQQLYFSHFNQMIDRSHELLSQVEK